MKYTAKEILSLQVAPALGCTEPVAVALAAATAAALLPGTGFDTLTVRVDPNVYKNGLAVSIPGTEGLLGLDTAAALGALGGDPSARLEVLGNVDDEVVKLTKTALAEGKVEVELAREIQGLHIVATLTRGSDTAECVITEMHDNIVSLKINGQPQLNHALLSASVENGKTELVAMEEWLKERTLSELVALTDELDEEDFAFLREGIEHNMCLAEHGLKYAPGLGIGKGLERLVRQGMLKKDMVLAARMLTSAASDARMAGVNLPAMSSAGSGNHGLTAILPIVAVKDFINASEQTMLEAIALSHIVTAYVKAHTGRLSAVCGCSVAAGAGATAGVAFMLGGTVSHMAGAIKNLIEDLAGIICDGAKAGCSLKLATAAGAAVQAALFALQGINVMATDGIVSASPEQTMKNIGELSTQGMVETDRTILNIMLKKKFNET